MAVTIWHLDRILCSALPLATEQTAPLDDLSVCTAADKSFFPGVQILFHTFRRRHPTVPFYVFDLGLTATQRLYLRRRGGHVLRKPPLVIPRTVHGWHTYNKPFYIRETPGRYVLWLDADCVLCNTLGPLFSHLRTHGLLVVLQPESGVLSRHRNDLSTYVQLGWPKRLVADGWGNINAGVLGFDRQDAASEELLTTWARGVRAVAKDPAFYLPRVKYFDQGMLLWALEYLGQYRRQTPVAEWNFNTRLRETPNNSGLEKWLSRQHPATIVHVCGAVKLWKLRSWHARLPG